MIIHPKLYWRIGLVRQMNATESFDTLRNSRQLIQSMLAELTWPCQCIWAKFFQSFRWQQIFWNCYPLPLLISINHFPMTAKMCQFRIFCSCTPPKSATKIKAKMYYKIPAASVRILASERIAGSKQNRAVAGNPISVFEVTKGNLMPQYFFAFMSVWLSERHDLSLIVARQCTFQCCF